MILEIRIDDLLPHPENPRGVVNPDTEDIENLAASIKSKGVIEPLVVTKAFDNKFFIIAGHRRKAGAVKAGLSTVPCVAREFKDMADEIEVMLIENLQREGLTPIQEAKAYKRMLELGHTQQSVAARCGVSGQTVRQHLDLLSLDDSVQELVDKGAIGIGNALVLTKVHDVDKQRALSIKAQRMTKDSLLQLINDYNATETSSSSKRIDRPKKNSLLEPGETFTRSRALERLLNHKNCDVKLSQIAECFDDVCQDSCVESGNESLCEYCPVPRFVESILRRINL